MASRGLVRGRVVRGPLKKVVAAKVGLATGLLTGAAILAPSPAAAVPQNCLNNPAYGCYARGTFHDGSAWGGDYVQLQVAGISASSGAYLNEEMWTTTNNGTSYWSEIGYTYDQPLCSDKDLTWFYFSTSPSGDRWSCFGSTSIGSWHQLEVQEDVPSQWYIYLDGVEEAIDSGTSGWNYDDYTGLEYHDAGHTSVSGNAYFSYNEVRSTSCCSWYYWNQGGTNVDYPGTYDWKWTATNPWIHGYDY